MDAVTSMIPVSFPNSEGLRLFGILHQPAAPRADRTAILLLSPGVKMRVAPHRMYNKMADRFVAMGYPVLRFDFHGLGDSDGETTESLLADLYGATQVGRYIGDTIAAMDWMQEAHGTSKFIAAGLCGGALTGLLTAERDARIVGLMGLSIPVTLDGSNVDASRFMTTAQLEGTRDGYLKKLKTGGWQSWIRLLTFQSDYRMILRSLLRPVIARMKPAPAATAESAGPAQPVDNTNPYFAPAFTKMVASSRRVLLVFAEADRLFWEFEAKFLAPHTRALQPYTPWYRIHVTKQANHIFSFGEWQRDMLDQCCAWLDER